MPPLIDITGKKFGRLTVIERADKGRWHCKCDCGNETFTSGYQLRKGIAKSCGCYQKEISGEKHRTHGYTKTRLYRIYYKMKERCYRPTNDNYKYYGGLGITICDEWLHSFETFKNWALSHGYNDNLTIDRINNELGYMPSNCRWITIQEQQRNRRKRGTVLCQKQQK